MRVIKRVLSGRLAEQWPSASRVAELSAYARPGQVVCVLAEGKSTLGYIGARSRRDFMALMSELGIAVHEG